MSNFCQIWFDKSNADFLFLR